MNYVERCKKIFIDLENYLTAREYQEASNYLVSLTNEERSISEMKSGLVITKAFKNHEVIRESRANLLALYERKKNELS